MNPPASPLRLGTRGSPLALAQARAAAAAIRAANGWCDDRVVVVPLVTTGDRITDRPLAEIGGKALWTKELDRALLAGDVDACVHSMKDVESERPDRLVMAAMLPRADVRDRLIGANSIAALDPGAVVGTSAPRRTAQLLRLRPDLTITSIRGNVETRLRKVAAGEFDATLLAAAGLDRLGLASGHPLPPEQLLPAPGQAAIGIECRSDDSTTCISIAAASDRSTFDCVSAERAFTRALGGTCASPVAALAVIEGSRLLLRAHLYSSDGRDMVEEQATFAAGDVTTPAILARAMLGRSPPSICSLFEAL